MKGAFLAIYEKIKASIQYAISDDAEDWSIMPSDIANEIDNGFLAYAEGLEEQAEALRAEQEAFMQTQEQTLAEHVFDEAQHLTRAQANEIAKVEGKVDKTDFKDHLENDERHLTSYDRAVLDSVKDKVSAEEFYTHTGNPDIHYPKEVVQEYADIAIDKAKAEILDVIAQGGGNASVDLSGVIDRISGVEGELMAHKNDPSIHFKIEETKTYTDAKLQEAKVYTDTEVAKIQSTVGGSEGVFLCEDTSDGVKMFPDASIFLSNCYIGNGQIVFGSKNLMYLKNINNMENGIVLTSKNPARITYVDDGYVVYTTSQDSNKLYLKKIADDTSVGIKIVDSAVQGVCYIGNKKIAYISNGIVYIKNVSDSNESIPTNITNVDSESICYVGLNRLVYRKKNDSRLHMQTISSSISDEVIITKDLGLYPCYVGDSCIVYKGLNGNLYVKNINNTDNGVAITHAKGAFPFNAGKNKIAYANIDDASTIYIKNINTYI